MTVAYDGACSPNITLRMAWISFVALPGRKIIIDDNSRLDVILIARVTWHAFFHPLWLAIRHMNRTFFPTTLSIPPFDFGK